MKKIWIGVAGAAAGGAAALMAPAQSVEQETAIAAVRARTNEGRISPGADLDDWRGLRCTVHLRVGFNPRAGLSRFSSGNAYSGLANVADIPTAAHGTLRDVSGDAVVIAGPNGHVWIPRDQIRVIEANSPTPP